MKSEQFQVHVQMEEEHWWFLGRRIIMREIVHRVLPPSKAATIVDIGCGTGGNVAALASHYTCVGIDPSSEAIACAKERFPGVAFICGSVPDGQERLLGEARLLLLMDVLEHMPDDLEFLGRLVGVARPGAHLLVTVPAGNALWSEHDVSFGHYRRYERDQLVRLWSNLPVSAILVSHFNARLYPAIRAIRAFNRLSGRTSGIEGTDFQIPPRLINELLKRILSGETNVLVDLVEGKRSKGYSRGASLLALLRRKD